MDDEVQEKGIFTITTGLNGFVLDGVGKDDILKVIKEDVKVVTKWMYVYSRYVHFHFTKIVCTQIVPRDNQPKTLEGLGEYFESLRETHEFRNYLMGLMGDARFPIDHEFLEMMHDSNLELPDTDRKMRSYMFQDQTKQYFTNLVTNIKTHLYKRLYTFLTKVASGLHWNAQPMDKVTARAVLADHLNSRRGLSNVEKEAREARDKLRFGISFTNWRDKPLRLIPLLFRIQHIMFEKGLKSFVVIPLTTPKARNVEYTKTALYCLLKRALPNFQGTMKAVTSNSRHYWNQYFDIESFEGPGKEFDHIQTDAVSCHVKLKRGVKRSIAPTLNSTTHHLINLNGGVSLDHPVFGTNVIVSIDEGYLAPWGGVRFNAQAAAHPWEPSELFKVKSAPVENEINFLVKRDKLRQMYGDDRRKNELTERTAAKEESIKQRREASTVVISSKSPNYRQFTCFELENAKMRLSNWGKRAVTRLTFDNYISHQLINAQLVNELIGKEKKVTVVLGNAKMGVSPIIRGLKPPSKALTNALKANNKIDLFEASEFRSSKLCSTCFSILKTKIQKKYRRMICPKCKKTWHRDCNAARNILLLGLHEQFGHPLPAQFVRGNDVRLNVYL